MEAGHVNIVGVGRVGSVAQGAIGPTCVVALALQEAGLGNGISLQWKDKNIIADVESDGALQYLRTAFVVEADASADASTAAPTGVAGAASEGLPVAEAVEKAFVVELKEQRWFESRASAMALVRPLLPLIRAS